MGNIFAGSEIVEMGIQIEKNGFAFYDTLVKKSKETKAAEVFRFLAEEEKKHIAVFEEILGSVQKYEPQEAYTGEYFAYMNALAGDYVFTKKDTGVTMARKVKDDKEAVLLGIGFEKDSILFYEGMKKAVPPSDSDILGKLITQEENHLRKLSDLKGRL